MPINPDAPKYPETDTSLLQNGTQAELHPPIPPYSSPDYQVPNDQIQPEVDIALLPGVPGQLPPLAYKHNQLVAATAWEVVHNLNFFPNVTVFDSGGNVVEGNIVHTSKRVLNVEFSDAISGFAILS